MYILMLEEIPAMGAALPFPRIESWRVYRACLTFLFTATAWPIRPFFLHARHIAICFHLGPFVLQPIVVGLRLHTHRWCLLVVLPFYKKPEMRTPHFQPLIALVFEPPIFYVTTSIIPFGLFFLANLEHAALYVFTHEVDIVDNRSNSVLYCPYNTLTLFHFYLMDATNFS